MINRESLGDLPSQLFVRKAVRVDTAPAIVEVPIPALVPLAPPDPAVVSVGCETWFDKTPEPL